MNILIGADTYFPDINGASYFTQRLAAQLSTRRHTVHVLCPSRTITAEQHCERGVIVHGIPSLPLPFQNGFRVAIMPQFTYHIRQLVNRIAPDIIHVQGHFFISRTLIAHGQRQGIPLVATNHFMPENLVFHLHLPFKLQRAITAWTWRDFVHVFNQVPIITTPTPIAAQLIADHGIMGPVEAISCGIDPQQFNPHVDSEPFRERYQIPRRPTMLYVGRLEQEKSIDTVIRALVHVRQQVDAQLVIVGNGKEAVSLRALAQAEGVAHAVIFTGVVSDAELPQAYALCDVFCTMGTAELQSIASLEAMASGKPLLVADAVALPHLVASGRNGYTIPPCDALTLAQRTVEILSDPAKLKAMSYASLELSKEHALPTIVGRFEQMFRAAMHNAHVPVPLTAY